MDIVSVVILNWNRRNDLREGLIRLREQSYQPLEIIVVDNGSTDDSVEMVKRDFPEVHVIETGENLGVEAYNRGFLHATGEYIVILDDDSFPAVDAIGKMVEQFRRDPQLGVVAFDVRSYGQFEEWQRKRHEDISKTTQAKISKSLQEKLSVPECDMSNKEKLSTSASDDTEPVEYYMSFNGAGAGIRRELLNRVGGYPGEFFLYMNETDLAFRIWNAGYKIKFFPDIVAYHKASPTNRQSWRAPLYYTRNLFWLVWKHQPAPYVFTLTFQLLYYCFYFAMEQKASVYLKAAWAAFRQMGMILELRKPVQDHVARNMRVPYRVNFTFYR
ncbi:glycosyltransferase family 2 protein [Heliobacterium mobile]|uniref:glycosyltransferase family 2 protein n=1 Tax=Heliobacterium mobile TaxID=28064 RepID=UPI002E271D18